MSKTKVTKTFCEVVFNKPESGRLGLVCYYDYPMGSDGKPVDCETARVAFMEKSLPEQLALTRIVRPVPTGKAREQLRGCTPARVRAKADPANFPSDGQPDAGTTQIAYGNVDVLRPQVDWKEGRARILNLSTPDTLGKNLYFFVSGQPPASALSTDYQYLPGDQVSIKVAIADSSDPHLSEYVRNASAKINIGNAPS